MFSWRHFVTSSFLELSRFNFENMMWYFSVKHNLHLLDSGLYAPALSNTSHSRLVSVLSRLFSQTKFDSCVALRLFSYLNEFLCIIYYISYIWLNIYISYKLKLWWLVSSRSWNFSPPLEQKSLSSSKKLKPRVNMRIIHMPFFWKG